MAKILIVDDEKSIRITLGEFLRREGYDVETAEDVDNALEVLKQDTYDIVLSDIIMPRVMGTELLKIIKASAPEIQVIIMTGEPTVNTAVNAVKDGALDYLMKPIQKTTLLSTVSRALQTKNLYDEKNALEKENKEYQVHLEETVTKRTEELHNAMQGVIHLLLSLFDLRDPYTAKHQIRVGNLAYQLARKMGKTTRYAETIRVIGYIHDIGKMVIPSEILSKSGKLTDAEMGLIREHPKNGYEMLSKATLPMLIAQTAMQHHERLNGSGYPNGLSGEHILTEAKYIAVADVVESMMSHRPYRPALGLDAALEEMEQGRGILYDTEIVQACLELFRKDKYELDDGQKEVYFNYEL